MRVCTYLFCGTVDKKKPNYKNWLTLLHQDDSRTSHVQHYHPSAYTSEYIDLDQAASSVVAFRCYSLLWKNGKHVLHCKFVWLLYNCFHCAPSTSTKYSLASPWTSSYQQQQSSHPLSVNPHMDAQWMTLPFRDCEPHKLTSLSICLLPKLASHAT